jgi:hypothetical protein
MLTSCCTMLLVHTLQSSKSGAKLPVMKLSFTPPAKPLQSEALQQQQQSRPEQLQSQPFQHSAQPSYGDDMTINTKVCTVLLNTDSLHDLFVCLDVLLIQCFSAYCSAQATCTMTWSLLHILCLLAKVW